MNEIGQVFSRMEKKYLLTRKQYEEIAAELAPYMKEDEYGLSTICNLYYDTEDDFLIRSSIEKPVFKEKIRLRSYGVPTIGQMGFVELKKKYQGIVYKRRIFLPLNQAENFLDANQEPEYPVDRQNYQEIAYFLKWTPVRKKLFLGYDRVALQGREDPTLRMTFDFRIRSRRDNLTMAAGDEGELFFSEDQVILEIKVNQSYPLWLVDLLNRKGIYPTSFSKYGAVYSREIKMKNGE